MSFFYSMITQIITLYRWRIPVWVPILKWYLEKILIRKEVQFEIPKLAIVSSAIIFKTIYIVKVVKKKNLTS